MLRLGIGTVQFGLNYGISNQNGKPSMEEISSILKLALNNTEYIKLFDTARNYGESETLLGHFQEITSQFQICTKIPPSKFVEKYGSIIKAVEYSLNELKQRKIQYLLTHHASEFDQNYGLEISKNLIHLKQQGIAKKIGISAYSLAEINNVIEHFFIPDVIQVPMNIFDQRLINHLDNLKKLGIEVHVRSIYLQGLIFMEKDLDLYFSPIEKKIKRFHEFCNDYHCTPEQMALNFIASIKDVDVAIVGINNTEELKKLIENFKNIKTIPKNDFLEFKIEDENFINPANWKIL